MSMQWDQLLSVSRVGQASPGHLTPDSRTEFQRDYDRLIFSSPFRRLQNKTQVFPLPGSVFVHNRLTHSLEVASVGRSMGEMVRDRLLKAGNDHLLVPEIGAVVAAACLAHDMGNPPFGHSGEDAIKAFFTRGPGAKLKETLSPEQWSDFTFFDGNANAFRILSHQFKGRRPGGFALTYTMMASIVKYPFESVLAQKPKFGFFQSEKEIYREIATRLGLVCQSENPLRFVRHPLVYLVEAADDICYQIMDIEDAHKLRILSYDETRNLYMRFFSLPSDKQRVQKIEDTFRQVTDPNEQIGYLRALVIGRLVGECVDVFFQNEHAIMHGQFTGSLIQHVAPSTREALKHVSDVSIRRIYADSAVVQIELAGYKIITTLLDHFIDAMMYPSGYGKKLLSLFPEQFLTDADDPYLRVQSVVDYVAGMTDVYALELYRKITGISLPGIG
jgi:dGTPase